MRTVAFDREFDFIFVARNSLLHLLSTDDLVADGLLDAKDKPYAPGRQGKVDWRAVRERKAPALRLAADRVRATVDLAGFAKGAPRLEAWALYRAIDREQRTNLPRSGWNAVEDARHGARHHGPAGPRASIISAMGVMPAIGSVEN